MPEDIFTIDNLEINNKENLVRISINPNLYPLEIIYSAAYLFLDKSYVIIDGDPEKRVVVSIKPKSGSDLEILGRSFNEELLNYMVYMQRVIRNQSISEIIVHRALSSNIPSFSTNENLLDIIDVHEHIMLNKDETKKLVTIMDELKISKIILAGTPSRTFGKNKSFEEYDKCVEEQLRMKSEFPHRFLVLYTYPPSDLEGPKKIEKYAKLGIDGLKFYNGVMPELGPINSKNMYDAYQKARELQLSVTIHVETWSRTQLKEFEQVLKDFPDVIFICPHLCGVQNNLDFLESMLDNYKNLYTDSGPWHRVGKYAVMNPERFREFFIKYSDRIMYATDIVMSNLSTGILVEWIKSNRELLEKEQFTFFERKAYYPTVQKGMNLPRNVLEDIYQLTPKRIFKFL